MLTEDGEPVYWVAEDVPSDHETDGGTLWCDEVPSTPGEYVLHARVTTQSASEWQTLNMGEFDTPCLSVLIEIEGPSATSPPPEVTIHYSTNRAECERRSEETTDAQDVAHLRRSGGRK